MNPNMLQSVLDAGLYEYGYYSVPLSEKWAPWFSGAQAEKLIISYNNSDVVFASLLRLAEEPADFVKGIQVLCEAFEIRQVEIYLPPHIEGRLKQVTVDGVKISVNYDKLNVREVSASEILHHPDTVENIGRIVDGKAPIVTVVVTKGEDEQTITVPLSTTMEEMIAQADISVEKDDWIVVGGLCGEPLKAGDLHRTLPVCGNQKIEIFPAKFCPVAYAQKAESFAAENSCGRCTFCREGNYQLAQFLKKGVTGHGEEDDLPWMSQIAEAIAEESVCSFGKESVRFLQKTLARDAKIYDAHFRAKRCEADVCKAFIDYAIDGALCDGCDKCRSVCPADAILDGPGYIHRIDVVDCTKCGECVKYCPQQAIRKVRAGRLIGPIKTMKVGYFSTSRKNYTKAKVDTE